MNPLVLATIVVLAWAGVMAAVLRLQRAQAALQQQVDGMGESGGGVTS